ncbi:MAG: flavin reductase family protein [Parvularculaceae bacterium]
MKIEHMHLASGIRNYTHKTSDPCRHLKNAFSRFATGVAIAACRRGDHSFAVMTVNSFTSVSLKPPLVLWCLKKGASSFKNFLEADSYAISTLNCDQQKISQRFASNCGRSLQSEEVEIWETGAPLLKERLAGFDCRMVSRHEAGDHVVLIGEVVQFDAKPGAPLLYFASEYAKGPHKD